MTGSKPQEEKRTAGHTPGKIEVYRRGRGDYAGSGIEVWVPGGPVLFDVRDNGHSREFGEADAAHLVLCWNSHAALLKQRDDLVKALEACRNFIELMYGAEDDLCVQADAALAAARTGEP